MKSNGIETHQYSHSYHFSHHERVAAEPLGGCDLQAFVGVVPLRVLSQLYRSSKLLRFEWIEAGDSPTENHSQALSRTNTTESPCCAHSVRHNLHSRQSHYHHPPSGQNGQNLEHTLEEEKLGAVGAGEVSLFFVDRRIVACELFHQKASPRVLLKAAQHLLAQNLEHDPRLPYSENSSGTWACDAFLEEHLLRKRSCCCCCCCWWWW
mmetsp:Transcript_2204/g.8088  ORF Transcript_2204/g.8088 Transcript_2204/m.8088 type:complete len:208 (-) Transcript_2204:1596-2219(-)